MHMKMSNSCSMKALLNDQMLDVPDPFALKRNVARSLNSQMVFEYIQERFRMAYKYFACPQSRNGANISRGLLRKKSRRHGRALSHGRDDSLERKNREERRSGEEDGDSSDDEEERDIEEEERLRAGFTELLVSDGGMNAGCEATAVSPSVLNGLLMDSDDEEEEEDDKDQEMEEQDSIAPEDMHYIFDRMIFTGGKVIAQDKVIFVRCLTMQTCGKLEVTGNFGNLVFQALKCLKVYK